MDIVENYLNEIQIDEGFDPGHIGALIRGGGDAASQLKDLIQQSILASGIVVAAGIIAVGIETYRVYFTKSARQCKGYTGNAKEVCMKQMKANALSKAATEILKRKGACSKSKNPRQCIEKINKKAANLKSKSASLQEKGKKMKAGLPNMPKI